MESACLAAGPSAFGIGPRRICGVCNVSASLAVAIFRVNDFGRGLVAPIQQSIGSEAVIRRREDRDAD
jgi:hypothetical protein